jgi:hypothetical protein
MTAMAKEIQKIPSLEVTAGKGGLGNLIRVIGEDSPEILTAVSGNGVRLWFFDIFRTPNLFPRCLVEKQINKA